MPIFMDRHFVPGITAEDAAHAHQEDVNIQEKFGCRCMTYWVDEERNSAFCLIDAPNKEAVIEMHNKAHGLMPHEIIPVNSNVVEAFLGRIYDPETGKESPNSDLKIFNDPAFRIIVVTRSMDPGLLNHTLGEEKANELLTLRNDIVREQLLKHEGREVEFDGEGFVISFVSVNQAVQCALAIQKYLHVVAQIIDFRIGIHAGVPVSNNEKLFGKTINTARSLILLTNAGQVTISAIVYELYKKDIVADMKNRLRWLNAKDQKAIEELWDVLDEHWRDPTFTIENICDKLSLSRSNLYRNCKAITGMSPNALIREFRLLKSLQLMKSGERNIAQTTFDSGFSSPSYFTRCFHKRFGLKPQDYLKFGS